MSSFEPTSTSTTFFESISPSSASSSYLPSQLSSRPTGSSLTGRPQTAWNSVRRTSAPGNTQITTTSRRSSTATNRSSPSSSSSSSPGLSEGALVGIGVVAGLLLIFGIFFGCVWKQKRRERRVRQTEEEEYQARCLANPPIVGGYVGAHAFPQPIRLILPRTTTPPPPPAVEDPDAADDRMERGDAFPPPPYKQKEEEA